MSLLLGILLGVMGAATVVTVWAVRRAPEGYEDEHGFHPAPVPPVRLADEPARPQAVAALAGPGQVGADVGAARAGLPDGFLGA